MPHLHQQHEIYSRMYEYTTKSHLTSWTPGHKVSPASLLNLVFVFLHHTWLNIGSQSICDQTQLKNFAIYFFPLFRGNLIYRRGPTSKICDITTEANPGPLFNTQWWWCGNAHLHILVTSCVSNSCIFMYWGISTEKERKYSNDYFIMHVSRKRHIR